MFSAWVLTASAALGTPAPHTISSTPPVYAHHPVSTTNARAQELFDRGLTLFYAYNGAQGVHVFQSAEALDPNLAMAYWGEALSYGRDINVPLDEERFHKAHEAIEKAVALAFTGGTTEAERAYITAMRARYAGNWNDHERDESAYRDAMARAVTAYPSDDDLGAIYAEALLENSKGKVWKANTSLPESAETPLMVNVLDRIIARNPTHVMANHLIVHIFEWSTDRSRAVLAANRLNAMEFAPEDEHLAHMPAHTYVDVGQYGRAVSASRRAIALFDQYLAIPGTDVTHKGYFWHDLLVGFGAAMMRGNYADAHWFAERLDTRHAGSNALLTDLRFGHWPQAQQDAVAAQFSPALFSALEHLHEGNAALAKTDIAALKPDPLDKSPFPIAVRAEIETLNGDRVAGEKSFQTALALEKDRYSGENLPYFPTGEIMGETYYRLGDYAAAESAYRDTLKLYPNDARALFGLSETLKKLGRTLEAATVARDFAEVWTGSDSDPTMANF